MFKNLRQSISVLVILTVSLAFGFAVSVKIGAAQTSKKSAKPTPTPKKNTKEKTAKEKNAKEKNAKATPAPDKKATAKAPSKNAAANAAAAKLKTADKKQSSAKTAAKTDSKNQRAKDETKNSKNSKTAAAKDSSSSKPTSKTASKTKDLKAARNLKSVKTSKTATAAKDSSVRKTEPSKKRAARAAAKSKIEEPAETAELPQLIVTDVSAPIRSQAKTNSPELGTVKLGTVLDASQKNQSWYKVQFSDGAKTSVGWIPASAVGNLDAANKAQTYNLIANRYYKPDGMDFATSSALYESLTRNQSDFENADSTADLQLKRLLALRAALKEIPAGGKDSAPYREFVKAHDKEIVYSEPSGQYLVASNLFWDLHKQHKDSALADQIAWEAAQNPLPGECEGYVNCRLFYGRMTSGEYLNLHPTGKHNLEALNNLTSILNPIVADLGAKSIYNGPTDVTDRAEFNNLLAELRTIVSRLPLTEKEKTLQQLKKIAEGFR